MAVNEKNIIFGGPLPKNGLETCSSLGELFLRRLKELGDSTLLINGITGEKITASQLRARSIHVAAVMQNSGIKQGDIVSFYSENRIEFVYIFLATIYLGAALGLTYIDYIDEEYRNTVKLLMPKIIFSAPSVIEKLRPLAREYSVLKLVLFANETDLRDVVTYNDFVTSPRIITTTNFSTPPMAMEETLAAILRTSGTTSQPKSVELSQRNLLCSIVELLDRNLTPEPFMLSSVPWVRPFGLRTLIRHMMHNIPAVFLPCFQEIPFLEAIQKFKPNTLNVYTTSVDFLGTSPLVDKYDLSSVKVVFSCSSQLENQSRRRFFKRLQIPAILQGYGMSELASISDQTDNNQKEGSVGLLRRGLYGRVVHLATGQTLGPNERGELQFKGPSLMMGYRFNEEFTRKAKTPDGWMRTGDYGYYDSDTEWFIVDRIKDLICYNDRIISPTQIESVLQDHPKIIEAAVIGMSVENVDGIVPVAFVLTNDRELTKTELMNYVNDMDNCTEDKHIFGVEFLKKSIKDCAGKPSRVLLRNNCTRQEYIQN